MDSICHVCARCFESTETLQKHIQDERSRLIRDVQELCTKPYLPVSSALGILVRYATHSSDLDVEIDLVNPKSDRGHPAPQSIRVHDERDLTCPESFCNYASTSNYQDLQRHYRTHVECDEACPFCSRPLNRVSQFVRHPDDCAARKKRGLEVPDAVSKRQKTLSGQAYNELRLARQDIEPSRRVETNSFSPSPHVSRGTGISSADTTSAASTLKNDSSSESVSSNSTIPLTISLACETGLEVVDHYYNQAPPTAPPASAPGDGDNTETVHPPDKDSTTARRITPFPADLSPIGATGQRAPTLSDSLVDGGIIYPWGQPLAEMGLPCLSELLPIDATGQRAPTLRNSLIDGALIHPSGQGPTEGISTCPPYLFPTGATTIQRAPTLSDSLIDGAMIYSTPDQYVTMQEGISTFEPNFVLNSGTPVAPSSHGRSDLIIRSNDNGERAPTQIYSTGDRAATDHHLNHHTSTAEGIAAHHICFFSSGNAADQCSTQVIGAVAQLSTLDTYC